MIYFNLFVVDCKLGSWTEGECNATCGESVNKTLSRQILQKASKMEKNSSGMHYLPERL